MRIVTLAATQMECGSDRAANLDAAEALVREAAKAGAQVILIQELFETPYFCKDQDPAHFALALPLDGHPAIRRFQALAAALGVVLPVSVFERAGPAHFNSLAMIDADGSLLGSYRKAHIPDGPGYQEKFYFTPGDTGFRVWRTRFGMVGAAICWDQWFPETARALALQGAEMLLYPTAIGSEPQAPDTDSCGHWQRAMQGHAAANMLPVVASNRIGREDGASCSLTFYGSSFIADQTGAMVAEAPRDRRAVVTARFDLDALALQRAAWGLFRDRRPDLYGALLTSDGRTARPSRHDGRGH
ncbi:MAG: N-carbamoylputrescine amidase [Alphaproteobacteria bacterium]|nr:N-carbamoylputrescine amidase [Alphaproteobacteria bacterium]